MAGVSSENVANTSPQKVVTRKGSKLTLNAPLDESGTWTVTVRAQSGSAADVGWSYRVKQPRGVTYAED